jgi:hypothetical protein
MLSYIHPGRRSAAKLLTKDEAQANSRQQRLVLLLWIVLSLLLGEFGPLLEIFRHVHEMEAGRIIPPQVIC